MDLTESIAPKSDQLNADDLITGPRTYTIDRVTKGSTEQPFNIHLVENPGHPYRPSKSMRRVLVMAWGKESDEWPTGGRITLFRDPEVKFGREEVGGIKISHLSHLSRPMTIALTVTRGKREPHTVQPLPQTPQGESPRGAARVLDTPGAGKVEGAGVAASSTPPPADTITDAHERVIRGQMKRTGIDGARVLEFAQQASGRAISSARDLTSVEADALIVLLADLPDAKSEES